MKYQPFLEQAIVINRSFNIFYDSYNTIMSYIINLESQVHNESIDREKIDHIVHMMSDILDNANSNNKLFKQLYTIEDTFREMNIKITQVFI